MNCARCGAKLGERYVHSRHSGANYCSDPAACDKRAARKKRSRARVVATDDGKYGDMRDSVSQGWLGP